MEQQPPGGDRVEISVLLPCYNGADTLSVQLEALARQSWNGAWEVVFIDNGSTDGSAAIAESYRDRLPRLRIVMASPPGSPKGGVDHSYRVGFEAARGDAFLLCEADDEVADDWLSVMADRVQKHAFVICALDRQRLNPPELVWGELGQQSREEGLGANVSPLFLPYGLGCAFGLQRAAVDQIGPPASDVGPSWDTDYCWRAQMAGIPLTWVPETHVHYRVRVSSRDRFRQGRGYGRGITALDLKYAQARPHRYLAYLIKQTPWLLGKVAFGTCFTHRPFAYWLWEWGFLVGQADMYPKVLAQARKSRRRPGLSHGKAQSMPQAVKSATSADASSNKP